MAVAQFRDIPKWTESADFYPAAAVLKAFFTELSVPILSWNMLQELSPVMDPGRCVRLANSLANEHRDTLMYLVGFVRDYCDAYERYAMHPLFEDIVGSVCPMLVKAVNEAEFPELVKGLRRFLYCLVDSWQTRDVYEPSTELARTSEA
jgi:hypothetical protein